MSVKRPMEQEMMSYRKKVAYDNNIGVTTQIHSVSIIDSSNFLVADSIDGEVSEAESIYSIQSKVTAVVKDSSDDLWFLESNSDDDLISRVFANEYEPDNHYAVEGLNSDSEDDDGSSSQEEIIVICENESDLEFFADCEESDIDSGGYVDDDLIEDDKWTCPNCAMLNWPLHRFCDFCWTLRPDWLPAPPASSQTGHSIKASSTSQLSVGAAAGSAVDQTEGSCYSNSSETFVDPNAVKSVDTDNSKQLKNDFCNTNSPLSSSLAATAANNMCMICISAPKNASIIHGSSGHQACCLRCAKRLKSRRQPCPVCRRPIHRVIRNYVV